MWKILGYRMESCLQTLNAKIRSVDSVLGQTLATKSLCKGVKAVFLKD